MTALREIAWAKLNLTLHVLGRRPDGFHSIESLVAFAGVGDTVELNPLDGLDLRIEGPFAAALDGGNLITKAAEVAKAKAPGLTLGSFRLVKVLPVAAGLGGGSADAAAALRLVAKANPGKVTDLGLSELAAKLGSDVAVCLKSEPAMITGRGEVVSPVEGFPPCGVVLANPVVPLATAAVYGALGAPQLAAPPHPPVPLDFGRDFDKLIDVVRPRGNDLEPAAARLAPQIVELLAALAALKEVRLVRLSGSGPTCFALFAEPRAAHHAAAELAHSHPDWWIAASSLGDPSR